jgi:hypothetical protein
MDLARDVLTDLPRATARVPSPQDTSVVTLIPVSGVPGLEVATPGGYWVQPEGEWGLTRSDVIVLNGVFTQVSHKCVDGTKYACTGRGLGDNLDKSVERFHCPRD